MMRHWKVTPDVVLENVNVGRGLVELDGPLAAVSGAPTRSMIAAPRFTCLPTGFVTVDSPVSGNCTEPVRRSAFRTAAGLGGVPVRSSQADEMAATTPATIAPAPEVPENSE